MDRYLNFLEETYPVSWVNSKFAEDNNFSSTERKGDPEVIKEMESNLKVMISNKSPEEKIKLLNELSNYPVVNENIASFKNAINNVLKGLTNGK